MAKGRRRASEAASPAAPPDLPMASAIIMRDVDELVPYARNSRTHSEAQIAQIAGSILGLKQVPTIDGSWMSERQRRAYVIADNKLALNAGWDEEMLAGELAELDLSGFDLSFTGFNDAELRAMGIGGLGEGDDAPRETAKPSWAVVIECQDEADQVALIERLTAEGRKVKGAVG